MINFLYPTAILFILLSAGIYSGYKYFQESQKQISELKANIIAYESVVKTSTEAIERLQAETVRMEQLNNELQVKLQQAEEYKSSLTQKLNEHDLTKLSAAKPGMIEKRVNDATTQIFQELEQITALPSPPAQ